MLTPQLLLLLLLLRLVLQLLQEVAGSLIHPFLSCPQAYALLANGTTCTVLVIFFTPSVI
jgi:hypothetical protein